MHKLFLINCTPALVDAFIAQGYEVKSLFGQDGKMDVPAKLDALDFQPDMILQQESLGRRLFLNGLHKVDCIKIFWSVDTHMNMYWHEYYADIFDCVLTTQKKYVQALRNKCGAKVEWMPWMAIPSGAAVIGAGVAPHTRREHDLTFVGRITSHRRSRLWFVKFLNEHYKLNLEDNLNFNQMMEVYRKTRIVPNEALFGEINFRLFEGAACGCAVVTPDVGGGLDELFEIGHEIEVYSDVLELKEILDRLTKNPARSGALGMAAHVRVLRDHLPQSRASTICDIAKTISRRDMSEEHERLQLCVSEFLLGEGGGIAINWDGLLKQLLDLPQSEKRDAALLRIFAKSGLKDFFMKIVYPYLEKKSVSTDCYFNMSASLSALKLGLWEVAKHFWYSYKAQGRVEDVAKPVDDVNLLKLWGDALFKNGKAIRSGVAFDEIEGIPSCASDCFFAALHRLPSDKEIYRKLDVVFNGVKGGEPSRLGFLSHLSLHYPEDWRISAEVAVTSLRVFRLNEGLKELENARIIARRTGQERFFKRKIKSEIPVFSKLVNQKEV